MIALEPAKSQPLSCKRLGRLSLILVCFLACCDGDDDDGNVLLASIATDVSAVKVGRAKQRTGHYHQSVGWAYFESDSYAVFAIVAEAAGRFGGGVVGGL